MNLALQAVADPDALASRAAPDSRLLRSALGQFATGITVVTARAATGVFVGLTVNSFAALSLDPPLILWSLRASSPSLPVFEKTERFVVNVLAEAQVDLSRRFASPQADKFDGVAHAENQWGLPLLHGASAWLECRTLSRQTAGDHCLFIAEVERFTASEVAPLLFHAGGYFALGSRL
ncbi:flavin reductase family protein [Polaromonas sp. SM01]|uniref:flavin reductase family protein n=1 Tax=Polaromonas sp. SM01 TaxID=3085630 RepID=UPI002980E919|nr:flavin reductase family protein [Polaromonas sp. SM01]MDW5441708.1 flavin reductase family protein [Polaromonas sp. SM01]